MKLLSDLCYPAWVALGLPKDLFSIEKEKVAAEKAGEKHVNNSISVVMRQRRLSETEATELCREKIKEHVAEYVEIVRRESIREDVSQDLRLFVEAIEYVISRNLVWTLGSPRYHPEISHNARQLYWTKHGIPESIHN